MRQSLVIAAALLSIAACSGDDDGAPEPAVTTTTEGRSTSVPSTTSASTSPPTSSTAPDTTGPSTTTPGGAVVAWPAAGVQFGTPQAAAADFAAQVFGTGAVLGAFRAGDGASGEVEVFASDENGRAIGSARSTLLMRQFGGSWTVLAAVSDGASIASPAAGESVDGIVTVAGAARGFEANVNVRAVLRDDPTRVLDEEVTQGGNLDRSRPYEVELDLSSAQSGDVVLIVVHGGVGLETDPGDTAVIPVVIS